MTSAPLRAEGHPRVLVLELRDHLTRDQLDSRLRVLEQGLETTQGRRPLLIDCLTMSGYDAEARSGFVEWNKLHRHRISRVAIVTEKRVWHMVVAAMALASGQQMKAFTRREEATDWLTHESSGS